MPDNPAHRMILRTVGGMLIGALSVTALLRIGALEAVAGWRSEEMVSTALGGMLLMVALITGTGATNRRTYRALTDEGLEDPVEPETLANLRRQALASALFGLLLLVPPIAAHWGWTGTAAVAPIAVLLGLLAGLAWLHVVLMRQGDELYRAVTVESGYASATVITLALFGWAALEKLGVLPALDSWTQLTAVIALSLIASTVVSVRRGLVGK